MSKVFTTAAVQKLKANGKRREVKDGASTGLYLIIQASGHKSWALRFRKPDGTPAKLTLGPVDFSGAELAGAPVVGQPLSLPAARQLATELHRQRAMGKDVVADVKMERQRRDVEDGASTFANLARQYIKEHAMVRTRGWQNTARYLGLRLDGVIPGGIVDLWGDKSISSITVGDVRDIVYQAQHDVTPGATKSTRRNGQSDSAGRSVVRVLSKFFNWVVEHGKLEVSPVAGVKAPKPGQARDRVLSNDEIRKFWSAAGEQLPEFAAPLRLLLLTGCRVNEVAGMRRSELSEDLSTWTIPGSRTKNKRTHVVPLPQLARDILFHIFQNTSGEHVFSTTGGRLPVQLGTRIKRKLDARMAIAPWTLHDLRRTAVTGMVELGISAHVVELVVNHVSGTLAGVAGIYNRATMMTDRKAALERWAAHVEGLVSGRTANVTAMRRTS